MTKVELNFPRWKIAVVLTSIFVTSTFIDAADESPFVLPNLGRDPPKPTVPPDLANYFQLPDAGARKFVGSYFPGFIPPASFDVVDPYHQQQALLNSANSGQLASNGNNQNPLSALANLPFLNQIPEAFHNSFNIAPAVGNNNGFKSRADQPLSLAGNGSSSIAGIPKVFPTLPKAPIPQTASIYPSLVTRPEVPDGGLGPLASSTKHGSNNNDNNGLFTNSGNQNSVLNAYNLIQTLTGSNGNSASQNQAPPPSPFTTNSNSAPFPTQGQNNENLLNQLLKSVGLGSLGQNVDLSSVNSILGLAQQQQSNAPQSGILSNVLYNALLDNNVQTQDNNGPNGTNVIDSKANAAMIQNLLTQPTSPFCNPKPTPVDKFNVDSFVGKWYQVLYSPPLSAGPCSMITYQKLADVGQGGPGTVFDTFEYTTDASPYGKPRISSGYGIIRGPGQLIYRTTNSPTDVNVFILQTGPTNADNQYEYVVLAVNCNYPLHVFARDPMVYKQKYETEVNGMLEKKGLVTGLSRLLNMVAPVDYNLCTFPPSLFNVRG